MRPPVILAATTLVLTACAASPSNLEPVGPGTTAPVVREGPVVSTTSAVPDLELTLITDRLVEPVALGTRPGDDRIYVAERLGRIVVVDSGSLEPFLDIRRVVSGPISKQGLLGFTFDRDGDRIFVIYTDLLEALRIVAYDVVGNTVDQRSAVPILTLGQPARQHQGGAILLGPDGYLWAGLGDGGGIGDPDGHGQNPGTLLGTIVRLDVDARVPYAVPPDNPFVSSTTAAHEVWAYGLRNPWRVTIDGGFVYIADVGQYEREEINIVPIDGAGANFGWSTREGDACFEAETCETAGLTDPALSIPHHRVCAVVGGPVYRGDRIPALRGHYFYGDYCVGWIRSLVFDGDRIVSVHDWEKQLGSPGLLTTFGTDASGEILVATQEGRLYRIEPAG